MTCRRVGVWSMNIFSNSITIGCVPNNKLSPSIGTKNGFLFEKKKKQGLLSLGEMLNVSI